MNDFSESIFVISAIPFLRLFYLNSCTLFLVASGSWAADSYLSLALDGRLLSASATPPLT